MIWSSLQLAFRELRANLMRSLLTTLGIIVGVAAVVIVVTLGQGITVKISQDISAMGSNLLFVMPFRAQRRGPGSFTRPFEIKDVTAVSNEIQGVAAAAPWAERRVQVTNGSNQWEPSVAGTNRGYFIARNWRVVAGREFSDAELRSGRAVCILGDRPRRELYGAQQPLGTSIRINNVSCEVIGLLEAKGQSAMGQDQDDVVLMPMLTFQRRISGNDSVQQILVSVRSAAEIPQVLDALQVLMRERRSIRIGEEDDFSVDSMQSILSFMQTTMGVLTGGLSAVAAISLIVGGIGIMNIMLVSVTERTREIGIRLAIGALERDVLTQFLLEAVLLSCLGGMLGAIIGLGAAAIIASQIDVPFVLSPWVVVAAFGFSSMVGIVFGFVPARRAAAMDPIVALRYE